MSGTDIRRFFEELFQSRLVRQLTEDVLFARAETERVRQEKDQVIAELRQEKQQLYAKLAAHEARVGIKPANAVPAKPNFAEMMSLPMPKTSWQLLVEKHDQENERLNREEAEASSQTEQANG